MNTKIHYCKLATIVVLAALIAAGCAGGGARPDVPALRMPVLSDALLQAHGAAVCQHLDAANERVDLLPDNPKLASLVALASLESGLEIDLAAYADREDYAVVTPSGCLRLPGDWSDRLDQEQTVAIAAHYLAYVVSATATTKLQLALADQVGPTLEERALDAGQVQAVAESLDRLWFSHRERHLADRYASLRLAEVGMSPLVLASAIETLAGEQAKPSLTGPYRRAERIRQNHARLALQSGE